MRFPPKTDPNEYTTRVVRKFAWLPTVVSVPRIQANDIQVTVWLETYFQREYWSLRVDRWVGRDKLAPEHPDRDSPIYQNAPQVKKVDPWWWTVLTFIRGY